MMTAVAVIQCIGSVIGSIIGTITIAGFLFYNKSQIDEKVAALKKEITDNKLQTQQNTSQVKDEIYDKLTENKTALENGMKEFITVLSDIKESDKNLSVQLITLVNGVKDELKNDYTSRYNDLLLLINTKANENDFTRLEQKFDKVTETITELKTIVQMQLDEKSNK